jgi:peptidyl-prolyl cis-trans isomerase D
MLQSIRNQAQGWIAWVIVGLIIITFALFGIEQYAQGDKTVPVAEVNGEEITDAEFLNLYNSQKNRLRQQFGDMYDSVVQDEELRKQVMDSLVESKLIQQWAHQQEMLISDQQLAHNIQSSQVFQKEGKFDEETYQTLLLRNGLSIPRFEFIQRQFMLEEQFRELSSGLSFDQSVFVENLLKLQTQERELSYLRIDQREFFDEIKVTDQQIKAYYDANLDQFLEPEKAKFNYIDLSLAKIAEKVPVDQEILKGFYEEQKSLFSTKEKRQAKHILILVDESQTLEQAQQKMVQVQAELEKGVAFEEVAKNFSQDPGSAMMGGDLGLFEQGMMVPEFDAKVFAMKEGEISDAFKTDFGLHIIKLEKIEPMQVKPFETVEAEVQSQYQQQIAEQQYFDLLEQLNVLVYEQSDNLVAAAESLGLEVMTSDWIERNGNSDALFSDPKVLKEAFSDSVLIDGLNSAAIEVAGNRSIAIRVNEYQAEQQQMLEMVSSQIAQQLNQEQAIQMSNKMAKEILAKVQQGELLDSFVAKGVELSNVGLIKRNNQKLLPQITAEVFKMAKPSEGQKVTKVMQLSTGDSLVLQLNSVKENPVSPEQVKSVLGEFDGVVSNAEIESRISALKAGAEIDIKSAYLTLK